MLTVYGLAFSALMAAGPDDQVGLFVATATL